MPEQNSPKALWTAGALRIHGGELSVHAHVSTFATCFGSTLALAGFSAR